MVLFEDDEVEFEEAGSNDLLKMLEKKKESFLTVAPQHNVCVDFTLPFTDTGHEVASQMMYTMSSVLKQARESHLLEAIGNFRGAIISKGEVHWGTGMGIVHFHFGFNVLDDVPEHVEAVLLLVKVAAYSLAYIPNMTDNERPRLLKVTLDEVPYPGHTGSVPIDTSFKDSP